MNESLSYCGGEFGKIHAEELSIIYKELLQAIFINGELISEAGNVTSSYKLYIDKSVLAKNTIFDGWAWVELGYGTSNNNVPSLGRPSLRVEFSRQEQINTQQSVFYKKSYNFVNDDELNASVVASNGLGEYEQMRLSLTDIESSFIREQIFAEELHYHDVLGHPKPIVQADLDMLKQLSNILK